MKGQVVLFFCFCSLVSQPAPAGHFGRTHDSEYLVDGLSKEVLLWLLPALLVRKPPLLVDSFEFPYDATIFYPTERGGKWSKSRRKRGGTKESAALMQPLPEIAESEESFSAPSEEAAETAGDGPDEPDDPDGDSVPEQIDGQTGLQETLQSIETILRRRGLKLILSLDIDGTISYGEEEEREHEPLYKVLADYMREHREHWIWVYNTSRLPSSMDLSDWQELYPAPDVLIMGGGEINYSQRMKDENPGLADMPIIVDWIVEWPSIERLSFLGAVAADYSHFTYSRGQLSAEDAETTLRQKQITNPGRLGIWHRPPSRTVYGHIFCYDRYYNKGAALKRAIEGLRVNNVLDIGQYRLVSSGDNIPDTSMMNNDMNFPFSPEDKAGVPGMPLPGLPINVLFLGSVLPDGARLANAELKEELLSDTVTVNAFEPNILGIMDGVLMLLDFMPDAFD